jgi:hypothetical protein
VRLFRSLVLAAALIPSQTFAAGFAMPTIPPIIPDLGCVVGYVFGGGHCITFTESAALSQVQSEIMQAQNLLTMGPANLFNSVATRIAGIAQTAQSNPTQGGDAAAAAATWQAQEDAQKQQWLNGAGSTASGAEQRAQIAEGNASIQNTELMAQTTMTAAQIHHEQLKETADQKWQTDMFGGAAAAYQGGFQ